MITDAEINAAIKAYDNAAYGHDKHVIRMCAALEAAAKVRVATDTEDAKLDEKLGEVDALADGIQDLCEGHNVGVCLFAIGIVLARQHDARTRKNT